MHARVVCQLRFRIVHLDASKRRSNFVGPATTVGARAASAWLAIGHGCAGFGLGVPGNWIPSQAEAGCAAVRAAVSSVANGSGGEGGWDWT